MQYLGRYTLNHISIRKEFIDTDTLHTLTFKNQTDCQECSVTVTPKDCGQNFVEFYLSIPEAVNLKVGQYKWKLIDQNTKTVASGSTKVQEPECCSIHYENLFKPGLFVCNISC